MITIDVEATGNRIKEFRDQNGLKTSDIQEACGFGTPQAVYKWLQGRGLPTVDNLVILADLFGVTMEDIIVTATI